MFSSFGLSKPVVRAVSELGYTEPTPVQAEAIPAVLDGRDLLAGAQTGTGKTAGFVLPILTMLFDRINGQPRPKGKYPIRSLILTPTRELAAQVEQSVKDYGQYLPLKSAVVVGGVSMKPQVRRLQGQVDVLVATPGRLLDHVQQGTVTLNKVEIFVLDEADRMLDMGFIRDIRKVMDLLPSKRQNLLFSATFSKDIRTLANSLLTKPVMIQVAAENITADTVKQSVYPVDKSRKRALLAKLIKHYDWYRVLVFTRTKHGANRLVKQLGIDGIEALAIHGNKTQGARTRALKEFKDGQIQALVATDVAARGIDIAELEMVVNYELPNVPEDYIHRIGRTGRAGLSGEALSLVCADEAKLLRDIEKTIGRELPRETVEGFEPSEPLSTARASGNTGPSGNRGRGGGGGGGGRSSKRGKKKSSKKKSGRKVSRKTGADGGPGRKRSSKKKSAGRKTGHRGQSGPRSESGGTGRKKTTRRRRQRSD